MPFLLMTRKITLSVKFGEKLKEKGDMKQLKNALFDFYV
jgi:hypothetical protein